MNDTGAVWVRRENITEVEKGRLAGMELFSLLCLSVEADESTGGGFISSYRLRQLTGYTLRTDHAHRVLKSLRKKGYIWFKPSRSEAQQPFFVDKYLLAKGRMAGRVTDLTQLQGRKKVTAEDVLRLTVAPQEQLPADFLAYASLDQPINNDKLATGDRKGDGAIVLQRRPTLVA